MNSTRRDTHTQSTKRSIIMARSGQGGQGGAGRQKVVIRNIWHVSVRGGVAVRGGEVGQVERLELRLDKHSHYAQLTICCQAIKYLYVHENSLRTKFKVQWSPRQCHGFYAPAQKYAVQSAQEKLIETWIRCGGFQISTEYYVKYLTAIKVEHYTCKYLILALLSCAGR